VVYNIIKSWGGVKYMSNHLLEKLEAKIDDAIETMEILRLQIEDLEAKNTALEHENSTLKNRQLQWEQGLTTLLGKLDGTAFDSNKVTTKQTEYFEQEDLEALV